MQVWHLFNLQWDCPTYAALIMFGYRPRFFMPGAYIQYVRFKGNDNGGEIMNERRSEGGLYKIPPELENFIRDGIVTKRPVTISILREKDVLNYPYKALRELMMNAVMHRDYQANMPTRLYQYDHHIEIMNPGGLYGQARPENFPYVNDYRNSVVAEMMKTLSYVNMFNHGIREVQELLKDNGCPEAEFNVGYLTAFSVLVRDGVDGTQDDTQDDTQGDTQSGTQDVPQDVPQGVPQDADLDIWIEEQILKNHNITTEDLAKQSGVTSKTIKRHIAKMPHIRYVGSGYSGHWEITENYKI